MKNSLFPSVREAVLVIVITAFFPDSDSGLYRASSGTFPDGGCIFGIVLCRTDNP